MLEVLLGKFRPMSETRVPDMARRMLNVPPIDKDTETIWTEVELGESVMEVARRYQATDAKLRKVIPLALRLDPSEDPMYFKSKDLESLDETEAHLIRDALVHILQNKYIFLPANPTGPIAISPADDYLFSIGIMPTRFSLS